MARNLTAQQAAQRLGISRNRLFERMKAADLIDEQHLPRHPVRDRYHLLSHEGKWFHPRLGMQYSRSLRISANSISWLADRLEIELPATAVPVRERADVDQ